MTEIQWMNYEIIIDNYEQFHALAPKNGQGSYVRVTTLESLGQIIANRLIPTKAPGRLFDFEPKP